jgi:hypothetical protein
MAKKKAYTFVTNPKPATSPATQQRSSKKTMSTKKKGGSTGSRSTSSTKKGGTKKAPKKNPRPANRYARNPRGGVLGNLLAVGVAATGVVLVNEAIGAVLPGAQSKPIVMLGGGLALRHFAPKSATGDKIAFIGDVIAVGGVVGMITPFIRQAFSGVTSSARNLLGTGEENIGEYAYLPEANLGEYIDLTGEEANAYGY